MARYVVIGCFGGCLPENEPAEFTNYRDACKYALELAREHVAEYNDNPNDRARYQGMHGDYTVYYGSHGSYRYYVDRM